MTNSVRFRGNESLTDSVKTPEVILNYIRQKFGEYYDPTPFIENFDSKKHKDGLTTEWEDFNFCNPPFTRGMAFVKKAHSEFKNHGRRSLVLGKLIWMSRDYAKAVMKDVEILLLGKVKFIGYSGKSQFGVILIYFGGTPGKFTFVDMEE